MTYDDLEGAFRALRPHLRAQGVRSLSGFTRALEADPDAVARAVVSWVGAMRDERGLAFVTTVLDERPRRYASRLRAALPSDDEFVARARQWCSFFQSAPKLFAASDWLLEGARGVALLPVIVTRCEPTRTAMLSRLVRSSLPSGSVAETESLAEREVVARKLSRYVETAPLLRAALEERAEWGSLPIAFIRFRIFGGPPPAAIDLDGWLRHGFRQRVLDILAIEYRAANSASPPSPVEVIQRMAARVGPFYRAHLFAAVAEISDDPSVGASIREQARFVSDRIGEAGRGAA